MRSDHLLFRAYRPVGFMSFDQGGFGQYSTQPKIVDGRYLLKETQQVFVDVHIPILHAEWRLVACKHQFLYGCLEKPGATACQDLEKYGLGGVYKRPERIVTGGGAYQGELKNAMLKACQRPGKVINTACKLCPTDISFIQVGSGLLVCAWHDMGSGSITEIVRDPSWRIWGPKVYVGERVMLQPVEYHHSVGSVKAAYGDENWDMKSAADEKYLGWNKNARTFGFMSDLTSFPSCEF